MPTKLDNKMIIDNSLIVPDFASLTVSSRFPKVTLIGLVCFRYCICLTTLSKWYIHKLWTWQTRAILSRENGVQFLEKNDHILGSHSKRKNFTFSDFREICQSGQKQINKSMKWLKNQLLEASSPISIFSFTDNLVWEN